jgi:hypothetical protein
MENTLNNYRPALGLYFSLINLCTCLKLQRVFDIFLNRKIRKVERECNIHIRKFGSKNSCKGSKRHQAKTNFGGKKMLFGLVKRFITKRGKNLCLRDSHGNAFFLEN